MRSFKALILFLGAVAISLIFPINALFADTIFLKNKSRVDGMIESENNETVEIHLGYGTTTFYRSEIDHIVRSDAKEAERIWQGWGEEQKAIERRKPEEEKKWLARQAELERLRREAENLKNGTGSIRP